jgi:hypothetical protein
LLAILLRQVVQVQGVLFLPPGVRQKNAYYYYHFPIIRYWLRVKHIRSKFKILKQFLFAEQWHTGAQKRNKMCKERNKNDVKKVQGKKHGAAFLLL